MNNMVDEAFGSIVPGEGNSPLDRFQTMTGGKREDKNTLKFSHLFSFRFHVFFFPYYLLLLCRKGMGSFMY
jgi:hypothetical protein